MAEHYDLKEPKSIWKTMKPSSKKLLGFKGVAEERLVFSAVNFREKQGVNILQKGFYGGRICGI